MALDKRYTTEGLAALTRIRSGEQKLGQTIHSLKQPTLACLEETLHRSGAQGVVLGIAEDIGVRANLGRGGAYSAFQPALEALLNMQHNAFLDGSTLLVAGAVFVDDLMARAEGLDHRNPTHLQTLRSLTAQLDERVEAVAACVAKAGKRLMVVGGGHNNAFPLLKAFGHEAPLQVLNLDPHADLRALEGRHSGNGFSYALEAGVLSKYFVLGLHEGYNSDAVMRRFSEDPDRLAFCSYEDLVVRATCTLEEALEKAMRWFDAGPLGLELDLDGLVNVPSSAKTPSGLHPDQARRAVHALASQTNARYLHLAEAAPVLSHKKTDNKTGKLLAYLMADFWKAVTSNHKINA